MQSEKTSEKLFVSNSDAYTREFYDSLLIEPRYVGTDPAATEINIFGKKFRSPIMIAPFAAMIAGREEGSMGLVEAASLSGTMYWATHLVEGEAEKIREAGVPFVVNCKPLGDHNSIRERIKQAEQEGATALFIDLDQQFKSSTGSWDCFKDRPDYKPDSCDGLAGSHTMDDLWSYAHCSSLPIVIKGILSPRDALICKEAGIYAVYLSHHHGALQYAVPPAYALQSVRRAVGKDYPVFIDCGIESGMDAFKALALGANCVFTARHLIPIYKEHGVDGIVDRLETMRRELAFYMSITGAKDIESIDPGSLVRREYA